MKVTRNSEVRPAASLTGALLARRGGARPAMRRQPILNMTTDVNHGDDLGWNDLGEDRGVARSAGTNMPPLPDLMHDVPHSTLADQINLLGRQATSAAKRSHAKKQSAPSPDMERKIAFTLRIDAERHLRLRLLSALSKRSAQRLLTEALDCMIAQSEALNALMEGMESSPVAAAGEKKRRI